MESLRNEQVEDIKQLAQLNRVKITLVTAIAAVAFGIGTNSNIGHYAPILLAMTPLVCLYVDFQYYHNLAKVFARAAFLRSVQSDDVETLINQEYERFIDCIRNKAAPEMFGFESRAQLGSSYILSIVTPALAMPVLFSSNSPLAKAEQWTITGILGVFVVGGLFLIWWSYRRYCRGLKKMDSYVTNGV